WPRPSSRKRRWRSCAASSAGWRAPQALDVAAAALLLEPSLDRRFRRPRRPAPTRDLERLAEDFHEPLGRELAVAPLAPLVLGDRADHRAGARDDPALLSWSERGGGF